MKDDRRLGRDEVLLLSTKIWAERSTCLRRQVGAVIARDFRPISVGYNGAPSGLPHCTPSTCNEKNRCKNTVHAEINAILQAAKNGTSIEGATLYVSLEPCEACSRAIINSGIKEVYYIEPYGSGEGVELLSQAGVKVEHKPIVFDTDRISR